MVLSNILATCYVLNHLLEPFQSHVTTFICHIKVNMPPFQQMHLSLKNYHIKIAHVHCRWGFILFFTAKSISCMCKLRQVRCGQGNCNHLWDPWSQKGKAPFNFWALLSYFTDFTGLPNGSWSALVSFCFFFWGFTLFVVSGIYWCALHFSQARSFQQRW